MIDAERTEPRHQRRGGLVTDASDTGQAVARIAAQDSKVGICAPGDSVLLR